MTRPGRIRSNELRTTLLLLPLSHLAEALSASAKEANKRCIDRTPGPLLDWQHAGDWYLQDQVVLSALYLTYIQKDVTVSVMGAGCVSFERITFAFECWPIALKVRAEEVVRDSMVSCRIL